MQRDADKLLAQMLPIKLCTRLMRSIDMPLYRLCLPLHASLQSVNPVAADVSCTQYRGANIRCVAMQHPDIYGVLLELADHCDVPDVRANAVQLLNCLPTHSQMLDSIRAALQGPQAAQELESLLCSSQDAPTKLLYTLQVSSIATCDIHRSTSAKVWHAVRHATAEHAHASLLYTIVSFGTCGISACSFAWLRSHALTSGRSGQT